MGCVNSAPKPPAVAKPVATPASTPAPAAPVATPTPAAPVATPTPAAPVATPTPAAAVATTAPAAKPEQAAAAEVVHAHEEEPAAPVTAVVDDQPYLAENLYKELGHDIKDVVTDAAEHVSDLLHAAKEAIHPTEHAVAAAPAASAVAAAAPAASAVAAAAAEQQHPKYGGTLNLGEDFPNICAPSTLGKIKLYNYFAGGWGILFSHPADFTPVCTTELNIAGDYALEFMKRNCRMIALSCDSVASHEDWTRDVCFYDGGKFADLPFPILADENREIATLLGMLDPVAKDSSGLPLTCRAVFIVGPDCKLKLSILYPATTGRNFDELLRVLDSLQLTAQRKLATPADWKQGDECIIVPSVSNSEAKRLFPKGFRTVELPSHKEYLRFTPDPSKDEPVEGAAPAPVVSPPKEAVRTGLNLGDEMPNFAVQTTKGNFNLHDYFGESWGILFSHPADFTPVCTTELSVASKRNAEFMQRNCKLIALSCDSVESHHAWIGDVCAYGHNDEGFAFPIIADPQREIATKLGMLDAVAKDAAGMPLTARAVFIVSPDRKLKLSLLYPATTGRNFDEILRALDSLQLTAERRLATPGNWKAGEQCIVATSVGHAEAIELFPLGVKTVDLPSGKQYLRFTPDPRAADVK